MRKNIFVDCLINIAMNSYFICKVLNCFFLNNFQLNVSEDKHLSIVNCQDRLSAKVHLFLFHSKAKCQHDISQCANISCIVFITQSKRHFLVEPYDYFLPIYFPRQTPLLFSSLLFFFSFLFSTSHE